jgi:hypothetical protein
MRSIKPIETQYQGCHFRSRQEARWAVFMDTLGVRWAYEPEGFELPDVGRYLPDFYLPDLDRFLEVKPTWAQTSETEKARAFALAQEANKVVVMVCECAPFINRLVIDRADGLPSHSVIENYGRYFAPDGDRDGLILFGFCPTCNQATLGHLGAHAVFCDPRWDTRTCPGQADNDHPRVQTAFATARSARFEFGRSG